jgi:3-isopropylmalate/(R)-2-methylmalate dehydratase large subunit
MGKTMIEKILAAHGGGDPSPGDIVWVDVDNRTARDFAGASVVANLEEHGGDSPVADPGRTFFTFDCNVPANTIPYAENQQRIRRFAREHGVRVYDIDAGIGSHVLIEEKLARPGTTTVGTDSHLNIMGSVGAFGQGMGDTDIAFAMNTGKVWFQVPPSARVTLDGLPATNAEAKDVALALLGRFSHHELLGRSVELEGRWLEQASLEDCITVASQATEMGAVISLIPPNRKVLEFFGMDRDEAVYADGDAEYEAEYRLDIEGLQPQIAAPYSPGNVHPVDEMSGRRVDTVFIGSCTNGTYQDLEYAARLLRGRRVADHVTLKVVPATRRVWNRLLEDGRMQDLFGAGAIVSNAGCGGCASGQIGMTGEGEVQISTSNRNFRGKQGSGETYLAGIGTAVASALLGRIASVKELEGGSQ